MSNFNIKTTFITRHKEAVSVYIESLRAQRDKLLNALQSHSHKLPQSYSEEADKNGCNDLLEMISDFTEIVIDINKQIEDLQCDIGENNNG